MFETRVPYRVFPKRSFVVFPDIPLTGNEIALILADYTAKKQRDSGSVCTTRVTRMRHIMLNKKEVLSILCYLGNNYITLTVESACEDNDPLVIPAKAEVDMFAITLAAAGMPVSNDQYQWYQRNLREIELEVEELFQGNDD